MRVLLTGGYGCIGAWITKRLLDVAEQVWIYDLHENPSRLRLLLPPEKLSAVQFAKGDITDIELVQKVLQQQGITHVIHLAGLQVPVCRANPILGATVNVIGTLAVFEAVRRTGSQIQRLVYASSAAVFGPQSNYGTEHTLHDNVRLTPTTHYGVFKCCNEGNARIYYQDHGLSSIGLRPWTVFGVGRDFGMTSEPTRAIGAVAFERPYHISYGGYQDMQFAGDVAEIFVRCLTASFEGALSFNIHGHLVDMPTFVETLIEVEPKAKELITYGESQIPIAYRIDDSGLESLIGQIPRTPLRDAIGQTLEQFRYLRSQGKLDSFDPAQ